MAEKYQFQINAKVGDHLINVNGETPQEAVENLEVLAAHKDRIHAALSALDGRDATEIVQKEKTWGARSQGGRTYPKPAASGAPQTSISATGSWGGQLAAAADPDHGDPNQSGFTTGNPQQLLQQHVGATVVSTEQNVASVSAGAVPREVMVCPLHGPRKYAGPGVSQAGKEYGPSYRCSERSCATGPHGKSAVWQNKDGSWPRAGA